MARPLLASGLVVVCVLAASGCGDSHSSAATASAPTGSTTTPTVTSSPNQSTRKLIDALIPPPAVVMKPGAKITVTKVVQKTKGWQVACVAKGYRVSAEQIRGQITGDLRKHQKGAREIIGPPKAGSPSIWVEHVANGAIVISCR